MNEPKSGVSFLTPEHLTPIRSLNLRAKIIVEGLIAGLHRSPYHGFSAEFLEHRPYLPGESIRNIDWRKFARTDRTVVRLFEDETNLYARILLDKSASMGFSSRNGMNKYDYARTIAASLAWIFVRQRDAVGLVTFDDSIDAALPPRSTNVQLKNIIACLENSAPSSATRCGAAIDSAAHGIHKRGMCVLISDLFDDPRSIIQGLRHLRFKRQDTVLIWLLDPLEVDFRRDAPLEVHDVESDERVFLDGETAERFYRRGMRGHREQIEEACRELEIDWEIVTTDEPFHGALMRVLEKRRRLP
ncbi:MAG: DUF58 domain-containing protein [Chitinivibrionales bacterium]|nr:DUF58 domain-containing protein [Chitinivibrionales bacterium]MBD3394179.1 DUF58 domain-containing protein [Chitinivibrionales bacterium]